jgi:hypothetical protein
VCFVAAEIWRTTCSSLSSSSSSSKLHRHLHPCAPCNTIPPIPSRNWQAHHFALSPIAAQSLAKSFSHHFFLLFFPHEDLLVRACTFCLEICCRINSFISHAST